MARRRNKAINPLSSERRTSARARVDGPASGLHHYAPPPPPPSSFPLKMATLFLGTQRRKKRVALAPPNHVDRVGSDAGSRCRGMSRTAPNPKTELARLRFYLRCNLSATRARSKEVSHSFPSLSQFAASLQARPHVRRRIRGKLAGVIVMIVNGRAYRKRAPVCNVEGHARAAKKHMSKAKHRSKMASRDRRRSSPTPALDRHTSRIKELERYGCTMSCERGVVQLEIKSRRNGMPVTSLRRGRRRIGTCRLRTPVVYTYGRRLYA